MKTVLGRCRFAAMAFGVGLLTAMCCSSALAGPLPMPLIVHLDLAEHVVVGKIVKIEELGDLGEKHGAGVRWGQATVEVRETLKGQKSEKLSFRVATWVSPKHGGSSPPQVYKVGDEGIWVTHVDGNEQVVSHYWGLLKEAQLDEVKKLLKELETRQWSEEAGGLRAWAATTKPDYSPRPVVVFCVKNCTAKDIYCPTAGNAGLLHASAAIEGGQTQDCDLYRNRAPKDRAPTACVIKPGEIIYMHTDYSWLDVGENLAPGKYQITVSLENRDRTGELRLREPKEVNLWTGQLSAKPVTVIIPKKEDR